MEMEFGSIGPILLKELVDNALNNGEWHDGFDIAVKSGPLDYEETKELFSIVKATYPEIIIDVIALRELIDNHLPQSTFSQISWLIADDTSIVVEDSIRVARFKNNSIVWVTDRVSWDGIKLIKIENNEIIGEWFDVTNPKKYWRTLKLSFENGKLLEGAKIPC